jgi:hypothetical protein
MNDQQVKFTVGGAVKVRGKTYLVLDVMPERLLCRQFQFTKGGRFKHYQDYNFPIFACTPGQIRDEELINEQRIQAILQRKPYSPIRETCFSSLIC